MADKLRHFFMKKHFSQNKTAIVLYDGNCNLCKGTVDFISKRNQNNNISLLPLQSENAKELMAERNIDANADSVIFIDENAVYYQSKAILFILKNLNKPYKLLAQIASVFPESLLNFLYRIVAKNRYRWFGKAKMDACERTSS